MLMHFRVICKKEKYYSNHPPTEAFQLYLYPEWCYFRFDNTLTFASYYIVIRERDTEYFFSDRIKYIKKIRREAKLDQRAIERLIIL